MNDEKFMQILTPKVLCIAERAADVVDGVRFSLTVANSALDALRCLRNEEFDVVMACFPLPDWVSPATLLEELQQSQPGTPVVIHAPRATATEVVRLLRERTVAQIPDWRQPRYAADL